MQDRFKSRVWDKTTNTMHYDDFVLTATGYVAKITEEFLGQCVFKQDNLTTDNECILMQCTGLKDKNGKLIFEGDIVKFEYYDYGMKYKLSIVKWENDGFVVKYYKAKDTKVSGCSLLDIVDGTQEVIGNIYEKPELLKEVGNA